MLRRLLQALHLINRRNTTPAAALPTVERDAVAHLFHAEHGLPQVDWGAADAWLAKHTPEPPREAELRRAIAAAWLDELRDALTIDHRRWRTALVEGLAPLDGTIARDIADTAARSYTIVGAALAKIRGDAPAPPIAIIALASHDDYYSFLSHFYPDEGEWGTSGGIYLRGHNGEFPTIVLPVKVRAGADRTIAHELTHHLLADRDLPQWVEEGLTQMMEERVAGGSHFVLNREFIERHHRRWSEVGLERFWTGESFGSPSDDEQELAYHLAEALTRGLLADRPAAYFAFARAARASDHGHAAAVQHLGRTLDELAAKIIGDVDDTADVSD